MNNNGNVFSFHKNQLQVDFEKELIKTRNFQV